MSIICALLCLTAACAQKPVATASSETEAIEMTVVLSEAGFSVSKEETGEGESKRWSIVLNDGWFDSQDPVLAMQVLRDYDLPRPQEKGAGGSALFGSATEQKAQRMRESKKDIERHLRSLKGVMRVSVNVAPPDDVTMLDPYPAKASISIVYKEPKPSFTEDEIKKQVAGSVLTLKPEDVSVILAYQPPRPTPARASATPPRNAMIFAAGIGLILALFALLLILMRKLRRQRRPQFVDAESEPEVEDEDTALATGSMQTGFDKQSHDHEANAR